MSANGDESIEPPYAVIQYPQDSTSASGNSLTTDQQPTERTDTGNEMYAPNTPQLPERNYTNETLPPNQTYDTVNIPGSSTPIEEMSPTTSEEMSSTSIKKMSSTNSAPYSKCQKGTILSITWAFAVFICLMAFFEDIVPTQRKSGRIALTALAGAYFVFALVIGAKYLRDERKESDKRRRKVPSANANSGMNLVSSELPANDSEMKFNSFAI